MIDQNDDASINYQVIGNSLLRYSKDGASYTDGSGETIWDQTFEMSNAQIASCGEYMAIADIGSNQIRVFNHAGQISVIDATYPISNVDISEQGVVAVILSASDVNYINMYDTQGNRLVDIRVSISQNRLSYGFLPYLKMVQNLLSAIWLSIMERFPHGLSFINLEMLSRVHRAMWPEVLIRIWLFRK